MLSRRRVSVWVAGAALVAFPAIIHGQAVLAVADITVPEPGGNGTSTATLVLRLADTTRTLSLRVSTATGTTAGSATAAVAGSCGGNADYLPISDAVVSLGPNVRQQSVTMTLCGDAVDEPDEYVLLRISQTNGSPLQDNEARATIQDDDPTPTLRIDDVTITEGASAGGVMATFTVAVSERSGRPVSFNWATTALTSGRPATAGTCGTAGADYQSVPSTARTIPAYSPSTTVGVLVCGDGIYEGAEHLGVTLTALVNATPGDMNGVLTISEDDTPPTVSLSQAVPVGNHMESVQLSNGSTTQQLVYSARFTVQVVGTPTQRPVTFDYTTEDATATGSKSCLSSNFGGVTNTAGDYGRESGASVTVKPPSREIVVSVCKLTATSGQTFRLRLSNVQNAQAGQVTATATIP